MLEQHAREIMEGVEGIQKIIAVHEINPLFAMDSIILATVVKSDGEKTNYEIKGKDEKPEVDSCYAAMLLRFHSCGDYCYLNPEERPYQPPNSEVK